MLLEKLNGTVPCLLDTSTIPAEEADHEHLALRETNSGLKREPGPQHPQDLQWRPPSHYHRTFSPHFHHFVEQCLQRSRT